MEMGYHVLPHSVPSAFIFNDGNVSFTRKMEKYEMEKREKSKQIYVFAFVKPVEYVEMNKKFFSSVLMFNCVMGNGMRILTNLLF